MTAPGTRVAVIGAGALGGYFGGRLAAAGENVVFIVRGAHLGALRATGLRVESPNGDFVVPDVDATDDPATAGPVDLVVVAVKAWQVPEVAKAIEPLMHDTTVILPLQNGVEAPGQLAAVHGEQRVLTGMCRIVSMLVEPGHIRHLGVEPCVVLGELDGRQTPRAANIVSLFEKAGVGSKNPSDIWSAIWEKFLFIASFGGVGAVTRAPAEVMRGMPETRNLLESAMGEIYQLAQAKGVSLRDDAVARSLAFLDGMPPDATASMQRDIMEGRPSELESQNGAVVRLGEASGVPTPVHEFIYHALLPMETLARQHRARVERSVREP